VLPRFLIERAGLESSEADSAAVTLTQCLRSAANLNIHLQCLMLDGVCERGAAGPGQYEAAVPAVLKLKTPWHDGTRHLATSPLKFMQGVAVLVPRQHRPIWPIARGTHKRLLRGGQSGAVSVAEGSTTGARRTSLTDRSAG